MIIFGLSRIVIIVPDIYFSDTKKSFDQWFLRWEQSVLNNDHADSNGVIWLA